MTVVGHRSQTQLVRTLRGAIESVRIKQVEFRENVRAFFPQGQSKLSVITQLGVRKAGFECSRFIAYVNS